MNIPPNLLDISVADINLTKLITMSYERRELNKTNPSYYMASVHIIKAIIM